MVLRYYQSYGWRLAVSFVIDLIIIAMFGIPSFWIQKMKPFERPVYLDDRTIQHPFTKSERIPGVWLPVL